MRTSVIIIIPSERNITYNKNNKIWFSDNPLLHYSNNLLAQPFPILIEKLREDIEKMPSSEYKKNIINVYEFVTSKNFLNLL